MSQVFTEEIHIRAPKGLKPKLNRIAARRFLKTADIVREALRRYVEEEEMKEKEPPVAVR